MDQERHYQPHQEQLKAQYSRTKEAMAAVHRRPLVLREGEGLAAYCALQGAAISAYLDPSMPADAVGAMYSEILTELPLTHAPLEVLAKLDTIGGGPGTPDPRAVSALNLLANTITRTNLTGLNGAVVAAAALATIRNTHAFGPRSNHIGRIMVRLILRASGLDPAGIAVWEIWERNNTNHMQQALQSFDDHPSQLVNALLLAYQSAAKTAEQTIAAWAR